MRESPYLAEIRRLDPVRDHVRSVHLDACYEFPFDTTRALELTVTTRKYPLNGGPGQAEHA